MYNVRLFKYPSCWQYRIYSVVVGFKENCNEYPLMCDPSFEVMDKKGNIVKRFPAAPADCWENIFTGTVERVPDEFFSEDLEVKKARSEYNSRVRSLNKVYHLARSNVWDWFFTLTFDPVKVDSYNWDDVTKALSTWLIQSRRKAPVMRYLLVPELHESGRIHFHGLFSNCDELGFIDSGKKTKSGQVIYNVGSYRLGFSTATRVDDNARVVKYISKYITKDLCAVSFGKKRYWASRNLENVEPVEHVLSFDSLCDLEKSLDLKCTFKKVLESGDLKVTYIEVPSGGELENGKCNG